jgi:hypothetical protein
MAKPSFGWNPLWHLQITRGSKEKILLRFRKLWRTMQMNSSIAGRNISEIEIQNISGFGIWLLVRGKEYFMSYEKFPWFKNSNINQILNVNLSPTGKLYWPDLDIDLSIEILDAPERFPLVAK